MSSRANPRDLTYRCCFGSALADSELRRCPIATRRRSPGGDEAPAAMNLWLSQYLVPTRLRLAPEEQTRGTLCSALVWSRSVQPVAPNVSDAELTRKWRACDRDNELRRSHCRRSEDMILSELLPPPGVARLVFQRSSKPGASDHILHYYYTPGAPIRAVVRSGTLHRYGAASHSESMRATTCAESRLARR